MSSPFSVGRPRLWREEDGISALPRSWGAYRFKDQNYVDYIGITSNLYSRISQHRSVGIYYKPEIHRVEYQVAQIGTSWDELCDWERRKIQQHSPNLVTYAGGNGRRPSIDYFGQLIEVREEESIEDALVRRGLFDQIYDFMKNLL